VFGLYTSLPVLIIFKCFLMKVSYTYARPFCEYFFARIETEFLRQSLNFYLFNTSTIFSQYKCSHFLGKWIHSDVLMVILPDYQKQK